MADGVVEAFLVEGDAAELIVGLGFGGVDFDGALEAGRWLRGTGGALVDEA